MTSIQPASLYRIDAFTGDNYAPWKEKIRWILIEQDLWGYVSGEVKKPVCTDPSKPTSHETEAIAEWNKRDQQAFATISLHISDAYLVYTHNAKTSHELWLTLAITFESKGPVGIVNTHRELFTTFAEEGANMEEHIRKLHGLQRTLHIVLEPVKLLVLGMNT